MGQLRGWQGEWERERDGMRMGESGDGGLGEVTIEVGRLGWWPLIGDQGAHRVAVTLESPKGFLPVSPCAYPLCL